MKCVGECRRGLALGRADVKGRFWVRQESHLEPEQWWECRFVPACYWQSLYRVAVMNSALLRSGHMNSRSSTWFWNDSQKFQNRIFLLLWSCLHLTFCFCSEKQRQWQVKWGGIAWNMQKQQLLYNSPIPSLPLLFQSWRWKPLYHIQINNDRQNSQWKNTLRLTSIIEVSHMTGY